MLQGSMTVVFAFIIQLEYVIRENCELMIRRDETLIVVSVFLRILQGIGAAIAETLIISFMIEGVPSEKIAQIFAAVEVTCGLGFVILLFPC